jgi:hypothetical protein
MEEFAVTTALSALAVSFSVYGILIASVAKDFPKFVIDTVASAMLPLAGLQLVTIAVSLWQYYSEGEYFWTSCISVWVVAFIIFGGRMTVRIASLHKDRMEQNRTHSDSGEP